MKSYDLKLTGRSGCKLEIVRSENSTFVRKSSKNHNYNHRLISQAQKQTTFDGHAVFHTPKVVEIKEEDGAAFFEMEYIPGEKYSDYFSRIGKQEIDRTISRLIEFVQINLSKASIFSPDHLIFIEKARMLKQQLADDHMLNQFLDLLIEKIPDSDLPVSYCHGDLTFSNMIFSDGEVYLVDFLDSFIDSPLIDIVKLRQDTCFYWTLLIDSEMEGYKKNKMFQIMKYCDEKICEAFSENPYHQKWYNYLQAFNLIRIMPYIHDKGERKLIMNALNTIIL